MGDPFILIVDDDPGSAAYLRILLQAAGHRVEIAGNGLQALLALEGGGAGLVLSDLNMPVMGGLPLLRLAKERWPRLPVVIVTVEGDLSKAVEAVREGAADYLVKPIDPASLVAVVRNTLICPPSPDREAQCPEIIGRSQAMLDVRHQVCLAGRSELHVLVTGETGTGKELTGRCIHSHSGRRGGQFVAHNCALSPRELFESRFFGHARGAFTGADRDQEGLLEQADGGVLFLDELETMPMEHQAMLLRVIDDGEVRRVGGTVSRRVSVRFIGATNRDLVTMMRAGTFREDLFYRLRGHEIRLPPLRDRLEDIPDLLRFFLPEQEELVSADVRECLCAHGWPGNVREFRNVLDYARLVAGPGRRIAIRHLPECVASGKAPRGAHAAIGVSPVATLRDVEREAIRTELARCGGNRTLAARALGIDRSTLRRKASEYGLTDPMSVPSPVNHPGPSDV